MYMSVPVISVVILNYKRRDALVRTLESVRTQTHTGHEVVVADNGSGDDIEEFLAKEYPEVKFVDVPGNTGCGGRNRGVEAARGELVVTVDNDVYFDSPFELQKVISAFERLPEASCLVFKVLAYNTGKVHARDWCHPRSQSEYEDTEFETSYIPEGACAFRREDFMAVGGYYTPFWIGCEGWDLSLRLLNRGGKIFYVPSVRTRHLMSQEERASWRPFYYYTRNYIWIAARNYTPLRGMRYLAERLGMMAFFSLRTGNLAAFLRGLRDGIGGLARIWKTRNPLTRGAWRSLSAIMCARPGILARLKKHRERPLI